MSEKMPEEVIEAIEDAKILGAKWERERIKTALIDGGNIVDLPTRRKRSLLILLSDFFKILSGENNRKEAN